MENSELPETLGDVLLWQATDSLTAIQGLTSLGSEALVALETFGRRCGYVIYFTLEGIGEAMDLLDSMHVIVYVL